MLVSNHNSLYIILHIKAMSEMKGIISYLRIHDHIVYIYSYENESRIHVRILA